MTMRVRVLLGLLIVMATINFLACGHYVCGHTFGNSTCTSTGSGFGGNPPGGDTTAAFAFVVDTQTPTIDSYTLDTTANTLAPTANYVAPTLSEVDAGVGMVVAQGKYLYTGYRNSGNLYGWTISSAGALTAVSGSPYTAPFLEDINASGLGQQNMITNPAGTFLFFADPIRSQIDVYQIGSGGVLSPVSGSPFSAPFAPLNLATDGQGKYLYAIDGFFGNHTGSAIAAYSIGATGALTAVAGSPFSFPMWQVQGEPTGNFLIGTSGNSVANSGSDDNHLYVFSITQSGANAGAIAPVSGSPFTTVYSPFSVSVQPNSGGSVVYSFGINDTRTGYNPIEAYQIASGTGALTALSGSPFSNLQNGFWGQLDQSGDFLFAYSSVFNESTETEVATLGVLNVGSGGVLTQPVAPEILVTDGYWAVTDVP